MAAIRGEVFAQRVETILGAAVEIAKRSEWHTFAGIPKLCLGGGTLVCVAGEMLVAAEEL